MTALKKEMQSFPDKPKVFQPDARQVIGYVGWADIASKGRGAVALRNIPAGAVLERCPVLLMPWTDFDTVGDDVPVLDNYALRWGAEISDKKTEQVAITLGGHILLYNHSHEPNVQLRQDHKNLLMEAVALRDIAMGEEITFNYDCTLWFDYKS
jgi:SET domain-containing protein